MTMLSVSLLMLIKNEARHLREVLPAIASQQYSGEVEIIAIDSGSRDGSVALLCEHGIEPIEIAPEDFHHGRTRNLAASHASHEILVLLSGDARPASNHWLASLVRHFDDDDVAAVYGKQIPPEHIRPVRAQAMCSEYPNERMVRNKAGAHSINPGLFRFSNANAAVRRSAWQQYPWNETVLLAEDQGQCRDFIMHGWTVIYDPDAAVVHGHQRTAWGEFQFAVDNGISLSRLGILNNPEIGGETKYGVMRLRNDVSALVRRGELGNALLYFFVGVAKWLGVQVGKREGLLPPWLLRRVSGGYGKLYK